VQATLFGTSQGEPDPSLDSPATLVIVFGDADLDADPGALKAISEAYPTSIRIGCSTSGHVLGASLTDTGWVAVAMRFEHTALRLATVTIGESGCSAGAGRALAGQLSEPDLVAVIVLSDGTLVNGGALVSGMTEGLPLGVGIAGGLAGDQAKFARTWVLAGDTIGPGLVTAVGLYGSSVRVAYGSQGGWESFGPVRQITKSTDNVLYEIDGKPALDLYKDYLGTYGDELPGSALLFPLAIREPGSTRSLVRTVLAVDEARRCMTFAGHVPQGSTAQLMRASAEMLVDGAMEAAEKCGVPAPGSVALAVSCVGRRLLLGERTEEEFDAVSDVLGTPLIGFYSNGELSPDGGSNELHNQTMTLVVISED
jgi:hypothetical protein